MTDILLMVTSGKGPRECNWVVGQLADKLVSKASAQGLDACLLGEAGESSATLVRLSGKNAKAFASSWLGTVLWVGQSPFRPHHKRKNWFVGVSLMPSPEDIPAFKEGDLTYQTMKAGGPGGQHVNTTDSAVRATHTPTGITVVAREERSQHANRRLAARKIAALLQEREVEQSQRSADRQWSAHQELERGNPVRVFEGPRFKATKHR